MAERSARVAWHGDAPLPHWSWRCGPARAVFTTRANAAGVRANVGAHVGDDPHAVARVRREVAQLADVSASAVAGVVQVHGADVWVDLGGDELPDGARWDPPATVEADALVTNRTGRPLAIGVADCMSVAIAWGPAIAAVHAGWRSLEAGILESTLDVVRRRAGGSVAVAGSGPHAVIGPCLGPCCFEVGDDVAARFDAGSVVRGDSDRPHLDARRDALRRLQRAGASVDVVDVCTRCDERLFSHRGDGGATGRQALLAWNVAGSGRG